MALRSIGQVMALLKNDHPDITISKIRFLENQGLITPERTPSGYRQFDERNIARLRFILREQKEHFLPLKVIRERLSEVENSDELNQPASSAQASTDAGPMERTKFLSASGLTESQLREVESFGLVSGNRSGNSIWYSGDELTVAQLAAKFLRFGVEARHLRIFKTSTEREADLYRQLTVAPRGARNTQAKMDAAAKLEELKSLGEALRTELLHQSLAARS